MFSTLHILSIIFICKSGIIYMGYHINNFNFIFCMMYILMYIDIFNNKKIY